MFSDNSKASAGKVFSELQVTCSVHVHLILDVLIFIAYTRDTKFMVG